MFSFSTFARPAFWSTHDYNTAIVKFRNGGPNLDSSNISEFFSSQYLRKSTFLCLQHVGVRHAVHAYNYTCVHPELPSDIRGLRRTHIVTLLNMSVPKASAKTQRRRKSTPVCPDNYSPHAFPQGGNDAPIQKLMDYYVPP